MEITVYSIELNGSYHLGDIVFERLNKSKYWLGSFSNLTVDEDRALWKMSQLSLHNGLSWNERGKLLQRRPWTTTSNNDKLVMLHILWYILHEFTFHTIWTPTLSLCVFIAREIGENVFSFSFRHRITEFIITSHVYFLVLSRRLDRGAVKMHWPKQNSVCVVKLPWTDCSS